MKLFCFFSLLVVTACTNDSFPKYQALGGFRVLGIRANSPEVAIASLPTTVSLTPVVSDTGSGGRTITITGSACIDPGVSLGAEPTCEGIASKADLTIPSVMPGAAASNSQSFGTPTLTGALPPFNVTIPVGITAGRSSIDQFNGIGYLVTLSFQVNDKIFRAYKRIVVSSKPTLNVNPTITAVLADGTNLSVLPTTSVNLTVQASGQNTYEYMDSSGVILTRAESLRVTYFNSDGTLKRSRVSPLEENLWTPPGTAPVGRPATIVSIVYDSLGGMAYLISDL